MRPPLLLTLGTCGLACLASGTAHADIYSCIDASGRTLTADRPIAECVDRPQRELSGSGLLKRQLAPSLTAQEQAVQDEKAKQAAEIRAREAGHRRRDKALLLRYPAPAAHDEQRAAALQRIDEVIKASGKRKGELAEQRAALADELEFYVREPSRTPASLKQRLEENDSSTLAQKKFIAEQDQEKKRINQRFDEELAKLRRLWVLEKPAAVSGARGLKTAEN